MLNQNLEFERVQREDKERMELREKEEVRTCEERSNELIINYLAVIHLLHM